MNGINIEVMAKVGCRQDPSVLALRRPPWRLKLLVATVVTLMIASATARAESSAIQYDLGGLHIALGGRAGVGYVATGNPNFGAGFDVGFDGSVDQDVDYAEGFLEPRIDLSYQTDGLGEFFGAASVIGAATRSNGDPADSRSTIPTTSISGNSTLDGNQETC